MATEPTPPDDPDTITGSLSVHFASVIFFIHAAAVRPAVP